MVNILDFQRPTTDQLAHIAANMWHEDVAELKAAGVDDIYESLVESVEQSKAAVVASYQGEPLVIYGLRQVTVMGYSGIPWMLTTNESKNHAKAYMVYTRKVIKAMLDEHEHLYNYVHAKNQTSIKWLQVLGFTIEEAVKNPLTGEEFHLFWIRRH